MTFPCHHPGLYLRHTAHASSFTVVRPLQSVSVQWQFEWESYLYKSVFILSLIFATNLTSEDSMQNEYNCSCKCIYFFLWSILHSYDLTSLRSSLHRETRASTRFDEPVKTTWSWKCTPVQSSFPRRLWWVCFLWSVFVLWIRVLLFLISPVNPVGLWLNLTEADWQGYLQLRLAS